MPCMSKKNITLPLIDKKSDFWTKRDTLNHWAVFDMFLLGLSLIRSISVLGQKVGTRTLYSTQPSNIIDPFPTVLRVHGEGLSGYQPFRGVVKPLTGDKYSPYA